jgi:AraC-like DNA-binding protein
VYREFTPRPELADLVVCTWEREVRAADRGTVSRVLPDGSVDLVWDAERGVRLAGPDTGPVVHPLTPGSLIVGLRLRPGVAGAALGLPASEVRDERVDLDDVWGSRGRDLDARLAGDDDLRLKRRILEQALLEQLPDLPAPDPVVLEAVRRLGRPASRVGALGEGLYVSERQLRRRFHEAVGYGPKTLDRVLRFRRFLAQSGAIAAKDEDLAGVAAAVGYADQAHLTRESVRLSGLTPQRLVASWVAPA